MADNEIINRRPSGASAAGDSPVAIAMEHVAPEPTPSPEPEPEPEKISLRSAEKTKDMHQVCVSITRKKLEELLNEKKIRYFIPEEKEVSWTDLGLAIIALFVDAVASLGILSKFSKMAVSVFVLLLEQE
ncbi:unnamed protein product [Caenorhabditis sp. 36 PRJEB53466]|nr:unnamed protein product [Caenorhabditis sp. 36 PRJEB53466]